MLYITLLPPINKNPLATHKIQNISQGEKTSSELYPSNKIMSYRQIESDTTITNYKQHK